MKAETQQYRTPPRTAMEVFKMLPEGTLAEVINNVIYMSPASLFNHQDVLTNLVTTINFYVRENKLGKCLAAPLDVFFDDKNVLQPDIVFISNENMGIVKDEKVKGAPDLIVELLSPGNKKHDLDRKKAVYEKHRVKEYFIVDPRTSDVITFYLDNTKYSKQESTKGKIVSKILSKNFTF